ncbi:50S ribosomal protein L10 [Nanoarchaeota archaeon]
MKGAEQVKEWKKKSVKETIKLLDEYKIIGVVNFQNLPAKQLQIMREKLRDTVFITMTKKRLIKLALRGSSKKDIGNLEEHLKGMPALLFSNENPFKLFAIIKKSKSKAPIKAGQIAPNEIVVPAGPTDFPPGPIIGELGALGIKTSVEDGKIVVQEDAVVAKEGEEVNSKVAGLLTRLGIEPMEVGLDLVAVYEEGEILAKSVLDIDMDQYALDFRAAAAGAFNLAVNAGYPTKDTIVPMIAKSHMDSLALAIAQDILTDETVKTVLAKANAQVIALESKLDLTVPEKPKEEVKEEKPSEDTPKEEAPTETEVPAEQSEAGDEEKKDEPKEEAPEAKEEKEETTEEVKEEPKEEEKKDEKDKEKSSS